MFADVTNRKCAFLLKEKCAVRGSQWPPSQKMGCSFFVSYFAQGRFRSKFGVGGEEIPSFWTGFRNSTEQNWLAIFLFRSCSPSIPFFLSKKLASLIKFIMATKLSVLQMYCLLCKFFSYRIYLGISRHLVAIVFTFKMKLNLGNPGFDAVRLFRMELCCLIRGIFADVMFIYLR